VFDRPDILQRAQGRPALAQMLAVIISAGGPHMAIPHAELARAADAQLRRLRPSLPACAWSQVIAEKRATYACTPLRPRPAEPLLAPGIYVAGDYVDADYPATLEAAVCSGVTAARALLADRP
jgi:predicted NAD/FAD-dependent oxidoreductase